MDLIKVNHNQRDFTLNEIDNNSKFEWLRRGFSSSGRGNDICAM